MNVDEIADRIVGNEGGFVDDPNDRGGATQYGVSLRFAQSVPIKAGRSPMDLNGDGVVDVRDIHLVTKTLAKQLFVEHFLRAPKIDQLPDCAQPILFDMAVTAGGGGGAKVMQMTLVRNGLFCAIDGSIGSQTIALAEKLHARLGDKVLVNELVKSRIAYYEGVVARNPTDMKFLNGWRNRANTFRVAV